MADHDLISRIVDPPRMTDHQSKGSPDRVKFNKDRENQQHQDKRKRKQKQFTDDDPHVDIQA